MKKYTRLDSGGLLFLSQKLIERIDSSKISIDSFISADSTNENTAGSKAVYELVTEAVSERLRSEDMHAVTSDEIAEIARQVWG